LPPKTGNAVEATSAASRQPQATTNCFCDKIRQVTRGPNRLGGGGWWVENSLWCPKGDGRGQLQPKRLPLR